MYFSYLLKSRAEVIVPWVFLFQRILSWSVNGNNMIFRRMAW